MKTSYLLMGLLILQSLVSLKAQLTTPGNEYQSRVDTEDDIEYVTVGSIMPYKVTPCYLGYLPEIQNPSIFKWWLNGNQNGFTLLKVDGFNPLTPLPPPNNVFYSDSAIAIHWLKAGKYTIRVSEKAMFKKGPETCESADNFQTLEVIVVDRPYITWKNNTVPEGCNLPGSTQQIPVNLYGSGKVIVSYNLIYTSADTKVSDTTQFEKTFVLNKSKDSVNFIRINIPENKYGQYKVSITNIQDKVSYKSGIRAEKTDIPATPIVFNALRVPQPSPIRVLNTQSNSHNPLAVCMGNKAWYYSVENINSTYNWQVTGGQILTNHNDSIEVLWNSEGLQTISVNVNTPEGCVSDFTYEYIQVTRPVSLFNSKSASICEGESFILKPSVSYDTIEWDNGSNASSLALKRQGLYSAEAKLTSGCIVRDTFRLKVEPGPIFSLGNDTVLCGSQQIQLDPGTIANTYEWSTGETTSTIMANAGAGNIWVKLSGNSGCFTADTIHIGMCQPQSLTKEIPNAFTPNSDGDNDTWRIEYLDAYPGAVVSIYNRWGQLVYKINNYPTEGWDGTSNGKDLPMSTYFYVIELNNGSSPIVGSVNIIR